MDNFFAKKGLTVSRRQQPYQYSRSPQPYSQTETHIPHQPYMYKPNYQSPWNNNVKPNDNNSYLKVPENQYTNQTFSYIPHQSNQNAYGGPTVKKQMGLPQNRKLSQYQNSVSKSSFQEYKQMQNQYLSTSTIDKACKNTDSINQNRSMNHIPSSQQERETSFMSSGKIQGTGSNVQPTKIKQIKQELLNMGKKDKGNNQHEQIASKTPPIPKSIKASAPYMKTSATLDKTDTFDKPNPLKIANSSNEESYQSATSMVASLKSSVTMNPPQQNNGSVTMRQSGSGGSSSYWVEEKIKLLRQIQQKDKKIAELEKKVTSSEQQYKTKVVMLEYEKRKAEGLKNRAQIQMDNIRKMLEIQRSKNDQAQNQMNKLMFFQDDLIHARDYNRLKAELQSVLTQNAKMFQDHQQYILEVSTTRRQMTNRIEDIELELMKLKKQAIGWREKIECISVAGEDKVKIIKLQQDINFLMKKGQQLMESMRQRENNLEKAHLHIRKLTENQNKRVQSQKSVLDGFNIQQLTETIAKYESRVQDLNDLLQSKCMELDKQKKIIDYYSTELRKNKQDSKITSLKEKSAQNSLKNQLTVIQHSLQTQIHLQSKKIASLEEKVLRKTKQVAEKDNFIKDFLIRRVKDVDKDKFEELIKNIKAYFIPETPLQIQPVNTEKQSPIEVKEVKQLEQNVAEPTIINKQQASKESNQNEQTTKNSEMQQIKLTNESAIEEPHAISQENAHEVSITNTELKLGNSIESSDQNVSNSEGCSSEEKSLNSSEQKQFQQYQALENQQLESDGEIDEKSIEKEVYLGKQAENPQQQDQQSFQEPLQEPQMNFSKHQNTQTSQLTMNLMDQSQQFCET